MKTLLTTLTAFLTTVSLTAQTTIGVRGGITFSDFIANREAIDATAFDARSRDLESTFVALSVSRPLNDEWSLATELYRSRRGGWYNVYYNNTGTTLSVGDRIQTTTIGLSVMPQYHFTVGSMRFYTGLGLRTDRALNGTYSLVEERGEITGDLSNYGITTYSDPILFKTPDIDGAIRQDVAVQAALGTDIKIWNRLALVLDARYARGIANLGTHFHSIGTNSPISFSRPTDVYTCAWGLTGD